MNEWMRANQARYSTRNILVKFFLCLIFLAFEQYLPSNCRADYFKTPNPAGPYQRVAGGTCCREPLGGSVQTSPFGKDTGQQGLL